MPNASFQIESRRVPGGAIVDRFYRQCTAETIQRGPSTIRSADNSRYTLPFRPADLEPIARCCASGPKSPASILSRNEPGSNKFVVLELLVSGDIIATGLAVALAIGLIGGIVPSIRAMLVRPLESLR